MKRKNLIFISVFLVSFTGLLTEILLTRIFSVTLWYHFAFFVVSLAMFGLSLGGTFLFVFKKYILKIDFEKVLYTTFFLIPVSFLPIILVVPKIGFPHNVLDSVSLGIYLLLLILFLVCQLPFFFIGFLMSYLYMHFSKESGKLYFFDLVGASSGAFFSVLIINYSGAINSLILLGIVSSAALILISDYKKMKISVAVLMIFIFLILADSRFDLIKISKIKGWYANNLFMKWNSFSMVRIHGDENSLKPEPFGWGMSPVYQGSYPPKLNLDIDGSAYSPITKFDGDLKKVEFLKYDIPSFVYYVADSPDVLIIGPGGGRDVLAALLFGSKKIRGVEVNPIIVNDVMKKRFKEYSGNLYSLDNVEIVVDDARSYIRNSKDKYGVIQTSLVDTWAATNAGAYALSENNLYTVEALVEYIDHLKEDGYLTISRWHDICSLKMTILYLKAAERLGIKDINKHIVLIKSDGIVNHIFKKSEFGDDEIKKISNLIDEMGFEILYMPDCKIENEYSKMINSKDLDGFIDAYPFDLKPSTDDSPFFFNKIRLMSVPKLFSEMTRSTVFFLLYGLFIIVLLLTLLLIVIPIYLNRGDLFRSKTKSKFLYLIYFSLLGISFMIVEISFLQKFMIFLGHPTYSITVVIFSFLLFAGIGSFLTNRIIQDGLKSRLKIILLMIMGIILCYNLSLYHLFTILLGLEIKIRILISILLLSIMGILMGMPFPIGIRMVGLKHRELIPFCWSLNGVFSVIGSILAVILSMNIGFTKTVFLAVILYFMAYIISTNLEGRKRFKI